MIRVDTLWALVRATTSKLLTTDSRLFKGLACLLALSRICWLNLINNASNLANADRNSLLRLKLGHSIKHTARHWY